MDEASLRKAAYSMPLSNPSYPPRPYRFIDREYMIITYRTDSNALQRLIPKPLEVMEPIVKYEFIRMPDSTGFGDYTDWAARWAAMSTRCSSTITRRLPADVSSGAFQRSLRT